MEHRDGVDLVADVDNVASGRHELSSTVWPEKRVPEKGIPLDIMPVF